LPILRDGVHRRFVLTVRYVSVEGVGQTGSAGDQIQQAEAAAVILRVSKREAADAVSISLLD